MSYPIGTTLRRRTPHPEDHPLAHLNYIRVVAQSPINAPSVTEWVGGGSGEAVVVTPADQFGPNEVMPVAMGNALYEVEFMPEEPALIENAKPRTRVREETPEESFKRMAREKQAAEAQAKKGAKK